jgi:hypothetical protein
MEALLFVRRELDGEAREGSAFRGGSLRTDVGTRGFFGREAEGGDEEQGEVLHGNDITAPCPGSFNGLSGTGLPSSVDGVC